LRDWAIRLFSLFDAEPHGVAAPQETASPGGYLVEPLSERELEVLRLIAVGRSNQEIAEELVIAIGTVKAHTSNIYGKMGVGNRTEAVARARQLGILP
jgi:LuxR family maltose regulon positive regulatory protein